MMYLRDVARTEAHDASHFHINKIDALALKGKKLKKKGDELHV